MKLYDLKAGTNPRRVRIFLAEKGLTIPRVEVDMAGGENRREPYLAINPMGTMPAHGARDRTAVAGGVRSPLTILGGRALYRRRYHRAMRAAAGQEHRHADSRGAEEPEPLVRRGHEPPDRTGLICGSLLNQPKGVAVRCR